MKKKSKATKPTKTVSRNELARIFDCSPRWVSKLVEKGMRQEARGRFALGPCLLWYNKFLREAAAARADGMDGDLTRELRSAKIRKWKAEAEGAEMDLEERRGGLIPTGLFESELASFAITVRARFLSLPSRIAHQLEGESRSVIRARLDAEIRGLLNQASRNIAGKSGPAEETKSATNGAGAEVAAHGPADPLRPERIEA